jgi:hypothetical protein
MPSHHEAWLRHQQSRWLRPDAARWVRPDAARFLPPGADVAKAFPALAWKYNSNQPRVPAGNPDGGQWTDDGEGGGSLGLFEITPRDNTIDGVQLAGDWRPGIGHNQGPPLDEPPEIPKQRPTTSAERTKYLRAAARWLARNGEPAAVVYIGIMNNVEWLKDYGDLVKAASDEPKSLEELQQGVGKYRPGYDDHHIVEQTWAERFGFARREIDDPSNLVSVPRLTHYRITGWYGTRNVDFNYLSPREYLRDKSWVERRQVGLDALVMFGVLKP